jgi:hypothetical protein
VTWLPEHVLHGVSIERTPGAERRTGKECKKFATPISFQAFAVILMLRTFRGLFGAGF